MSGAGSGSAAGGRQTLLVLGATGRTGRHVVDLALAGGHRVRALVRDPARVARTDPDLDVRQGDVTSPRLLEDAGALDDLVGGVDAVLCLLGDVRLQRDALVCTAFVAQLVPAMRRQGVDRLLHQAGGLSRPPEGRLPLPLRAVRATLGPGHAGQHRDNEAVMRYLTDEAGDLAWVVHRAGIGSDGPSKGVLERTTGRPSIATFRDCAAYDLHLVADPSAVRTTDGSRYRRG